MGGYLIVNPRSGDDAPTAAELAEQARERGVATHILERGEDPAELARTAPAGALGVAGGDGSLAAVAEVALERDLPFVCIPFGTRNHFARDLGLDRDDPLGALAAFSAGEERRIDVGRVGQRLFLNNVSLGVYAALVHRREQHRGRRELLAGLRALWRVAREGDRLGLAVDDEPISARIVLVANNAYELRLFDLGSRASLTQGRLHLYFAPGWLPSAWQERVAERFRLSGTRGELQAAIDGEPERLTLPLDFSIEAGALRVLVAQSPG